MDRPSKKSLEQEVPHSGDLGLEKPTKEFDKTTLEEAYTTHLTDTDGNVIIPNPEEVSLHETETDTKETTPGKKRRNPWAIGGIATATVGAVTGVALAIGLNLPKEDTSQAQDNVPEPDTKPTSQVTPEQTAPAPAPVETSEPSQEQTPLAIETAESATFEQFKELSKAEQISYATWVLKDYQSFIDTYMSVGGTARDAAMPEQSLNNTAEEIENTYVLLRRMIIAQNDPVVRDKLNYALHMDSATSADLDIFQQYLENELGDRPGFSARVQASKGGLVGYADKILNDSQPIIHEDQNGYNSVNIGYEGADTSVRYVDYFYVPLENSYMPGVDNLWIPR